MTVRTKEVVVWLMEQATVVGMVMAVVAVATARGNGCAVEARYGMVSESTRSTTAVDRVAGVVRQILEVSRRSRPARNSTRTTREAPA